ncbi:MAG: MFS transporter [Planctomycetaceae bacterium]|nr:MAG: MFS transporter [Planctomycetaceae bacterium]
MSTTDSDAQPADPSAESAQAFAQAHDPYGALRIRDFRCLLAGNLLSMLGIQALSMAIGWEVYERTRSKPALALVGLTQLLPAVGLFLPAGALIDRNDRRRILLIGMSLLAVLAAALAVLSWREGPLWGIYGLLVAIGAVRSINQPARAAFLPEVVPTPVFGNAVTWSSAAFQFTMVAGPALGGWLIYWTGGAASVYLLTAGLCLSYTVFLLAIPPRAQLRSIEPISLRSLGAGLSYVWNSKVILAAITLDMVAVLLGGATALLPVYAKDILQIDAWGLGWMRSAPGVGAVVMSLFLAHRPPLAHAGRALLWSVVWFGLATIAFGFSRSTPLSFALLAALGAADMVSVVVRHTLVQLLTPNSMRGRVSAVNGLFISISNDLGETESAGVASLFDRQDDLAFGPTVSVVSGGVGTILVVGLVAATCPALRRYGRLDQRLPTESDKPGQATGPKQDSSRGNGHAQ